MYEPYLALVITPERAPNVGIASLPGLWRYATFGAVRMSGKGT
jgi:hypothetical protein